MKGLGLWFFLSLCLEQPNFYFLFYVFCLKNFSQVLLKHSVRSFTFHKSHLRFSAQSRTFKLFADFYFLLQFVCVMPQWRNVPLIIESIANLCKIKKSVQSLVCNGGSEIGFGKNRFSNMLTNSESVLLIPISGVSGRWNAAQAGKFFAREMEQQVNLCIFEEIIQFLGNSWKVTDLSWAMPVGRDK